MSNEKTVESSFQSASPTITPISNPQTPADNTILVLTGETTVTRGGFGGAQPLETEKLAININLFVQQMGKVLESTPETLGKFHFDEFEIHAEINADGTITVLGSGVHAGVGGGLRFVFRRSSDKA